MIFIDNKKSTLDTIKKPKQLKRLVSWCNTYFAEELPTEHPAKSITYMGAALVNLALCYMLTKEKKYFDETCRRIKIVNGYEKWGNAHLVNVDLSASWILFGLSLSYDWLKNALPPELCSQTAAKLQLQAHIMYEYRKQTFGKGWATQYYQNHNWINMTGLAAAGLALQNEVEEAQYWLQESIINFDTVFSLLPEDGSDYEGVVYWRYGASWLFIAAQLFKIAEIRDYFASSSFLKNTFYYRLAQAVPNLEETANFGDCHDTRSAHCAAVYYKTAAEYQNPYAQFLGNMVTDSFLESEHALSRIKPGIKPEAWLEFLWYNPEILPKDLRELPLSWYFDDLGLVSIRSGWNKDAFFLSFKSGAPGGKKQWHNLWRLLFEEKIDAFGLSHQHPDANSFILHAGGSYLTIDDGYNRSMRASDHSVVLVDNTGYPAENINDVLTKSAFKIKKQGFDPLLYAAQFKYFRDYGHIQIFAADSAPLYDKSLQLKQCERIFIVAHFSLVFIIDNLKSDIPHYYTWQLHTKNMPCKTEDDYCFANETAFFQLRCLNDDITFKERANYVKAVMTTQEPENYCETRSRVFMETTTEKMTKWQFRNALCINDSFENYTFSNIPCSEKNEAVTFSAGSMQYNLFFTMRAAQKSGWHCNGNFLLVENGNKIYTDSTCVHMNA